MRMPAAITMSPALAGVRDIEIEAVDARQRRAATRAADEADRRRRFTQLAAQDDAKRCPAGDPAPAQGLGSEPARARVLGGREQLAKRVDRARCPFEVAPPAFRLRQRRRKRAQPLRTLEVAARNDFV